METVNQQEQGNAGQPNGRPNNTEQRPSYYLTLKAMIVAAMVLLLLIPTFFVSNLIGERADRQQEVEQEIMSKWALEQQVKGPMLIIPYEKKALDEKGKEFTKHTFVALLPERLKINGELVPVSRSRSMFSATMYEADLDIEAEFGPITEAMPEGLQLENAQLFIGISDFKGLGQQPNLTWDGERLDTEVGACAIIAFEGLRGDLALTSADMEQSHSVKLNLNLKGSKSISFVPLGKTTDVQVASTWPDPSFDGAFLPNDKAAISDSGFNAQWQIFYLSRSYPQVWNDTTYGTDDSAFSVGLLQTVDSYAKTQRSVKYALLFIALTFSLYFFVEIMQKRTVHPLQYVLVGFALCLFYTLLLSIGEYLGFNLAYLIAGFATVCLIALYTASAFGKWSIGLLFGLVLSALYGFIFVLIQLQDGALLLGSIGLFVLLAVIMYLSRKVDWGRAKGR